VQALQPTDVMAAQDGFKLMIQRPDSETGVFSGDFTGPGQALAAGAKAAVASLHQAFKGTLVPLEVCTMSTTRRCPRRSFASTCGSSTRVRGLGRRARIRAAPRPAAGPAARAARFGAPQGALTTPGRPARRRDDVRGGLSGAHGVAVRAAERPAVPQAVEHGGHQGARRVGRRPAGRAARRAAGPGAPGPCPPRWRGGRRSAAHGRNAAPARPPTGLWAAPGARLHGGHRHGRDAPGPAAQPVDECHRDEWPGGHGRERVPERHRRRRQRCARARAVGAEPVNNACAPLRANGYGG